MPKASKKKSSRILHHTKHHAARTKSWFQARALWQRIIITIFLAIGAIGLFNTLVDTMLRPVKDPHYGVSFSAKYAIELGLDWRETYTALLDDMKLRDFRLMSYWDVSEPTKGNYNFDDLDWQMQEAAKRGANISLSLGLRQPRWPECHHPNWYKALPNDQQDKALLDYITVVVNRYKDYPQLKSYQLENEANNTWFGKCTKDDRRPDRLQAEFDLVKSLDPSHPIWMSLSDQHGLPVGTPVPDKYGYSVYRIVYNDKTAPLSFYLTYPTPVWYHRLRAAWIHTFKHREVFIHELQLEPWGPKATKDISIKEQDKSMSVDQMEKSVLFARKIGKQDIYTWGGEWWYWRKTTLHDPGPWEKARELLVPTTTN